MARTNKSRAPALAYLRTSSAVNVGTDKDSEKRQRHVIQGFAKCAGFGVRTVIVEDASRFARELMAQELGITLLISRGVRRPNGLGR